MARPCLEIVTYQIRSKLDADRERAAAMKHAQTLSGFAGWLPLTGGQDSAERADMVVWASNEAAEDAARVVGTAEDFAPFRATISKPGTMGHFTLPTGGLPMMQAGDGVELGRFRLRAGVTDTALRAAHAQMIENHLSHQPGWRGQRLVRLHDGIWLDIAFAATGDAAQAICASWADSKDCDAFLAMIEPLSMEFGAID
ncbi:hypothetical protein [Roseinatronobacter sp. S2]|uniref:hypothetical protein n=1 Tax=Roseinatronobacter sp. S2 TaxID=3035471 RepID=UPI00240ECC16|nr:hypothetical protein [Roseinatronobacter sp. S2]WFE76736.1 hypothetical protein P8S53_16940 [Roseinatronobacter sp. S2]